MCFDNESFIDYHITLVASTQIKLFLFFSKFSKKKLIMPNNSKFMVKFEP
jgi:hypothetical protein